MPSAVSRTPGRQLQLRLRRQAHAPHPQRRPRVISKMQRRNVQRRPRTRHHRITGSPPTRRARLPPSDPDQLRQPPGNITQISGQHRDLVITQKVLHYLSSFDWCHDLLFRRRPRDRPPAAGTLPEWPSPMAGGIGVPTPPDPARPDPTRPDPAMPNSVVPRIGQDWSGLVRDRGSAGGRLGCRSLFPTGGGAACTVFPRPLSPCRCACPEARSRSPDGRADPGARSLSPWCADPRGRSLSPSRAIPFPESLSPWCAIPWSCWLVGACPAWLAGRWRPVGPDGFEDEAVTVVPWVVAHGESLIHVAVDFL